LKGLSKISLQIDGNVKKKLLYGEYERSGGIIIDAASGSIVYRLTDKAKDDDDEGSAITLRVPGILGTTLESLTLETMREKFNEYIKVELGASFDPEQKTMLDRMGVVIDRLVHSGAKDTLAGHDEASADFVRELEECYTYYKELFTYNLGIADKRTDFRSFPMLKICVFIAICIVIIYYYLEKYYICKEWLEEAKDLCFRAMKKYPTVFCKHISDVEHYENIAALPPGAYIKALKEIIMSPAGKPKIKFPPTEVIYLWSCYEFLEGYVYEIAMTV